MLLLEIYIASSFLSYKIFSHFVSVSHSGTSLTGDLKRDDSARVEDSDQKKTGVSLIHPAISDVRLKTEAH